MLVEIVLLSQGKVSDPKKKAQTDLIRCNLKQDLYSIRDSSSPLPQCITIIHVGFDGGGAPNVYRGKALW